MKSKLWFKILIVLLALIVLIQFYPYGRDHDNPPVTYIVEWDSPQTKETFYNACADCHSNETKWPWYSNIAPASWLIQSDVEKGRRHFNVSIAEGMKNAVEAYEEVERDKMPLPIYLPLHPEAKLDNDQKQKFIAGLKATFNREDNLKE
ncbi:MAG: heme-binding domain-containing protein [Melioribacteraceae bacterium]|jgi:hypothetical protein|nr:heme-binding domain-containing protein [Melioribacteraceae bacterium]RJP63710.1 MAG: cytochrome C [Ignavibacteriales bacterium]WKZ69552.1 MAG: heme-binding domain-containing protein [Melioribacteraceae bacterium]